VNRPRKPHAWAAPSKQFCFYHSANQGGPLISGQRAALSDLRAPSTSPPPNRAPERDDRHRQPGESSDQRRQPADADDQCAPPPTQAHVKRIAGAVCYSSSSSLVRGLKS